MVVRDAGWQVVIDGARDVPPELAARRAALLAREGPVANIHPLPIEVAGLP
jgi:hypothetical protein